MAKNNKLPKQYAYATNYTREQLEGKKEPQRDMSNRVALERPIRVQAALKREAEAKEASK